MQPLIRLIELEKFYESGAGKTWVLRRITFDVQEGDFISIMGPSGAGKSTLLHILGMHDGAWTGEFDFLGQPVHQLDRKKRMELQKKNVGFVFQSYHLLDDLTVYEQTVRVVAGLLAEPAEEILSRLDDDFASQSWLSRLLHGRFYRRQRRCLAADLSRHDRQEMLAALLDGYRLIQKRLAQGLQSAGISRIRTAGEPIDPERMIVVEVVAADDLPAETVCEEIRAGYMWKGRLLRSAEVRATRSMAEVREPAW